MLLLPTTVTASEANDTRRLLLQALKGAAQAEMVVDASNLRDFDSSALAVLLACRRAAEVGGKPFVLRRVPAALAALAHLYGVDTILMPLPAAAATAPIT